MRILCGFIFILSATFSFAQVDPQLIGVASDTITTTTALTAREGLPLVENPTEIFRKNIIKINLSSLALYNNSLSYERSISRKITLVGGYRYMPETNAAFIPLLDKAIKQYDEQEGETQSDLYSYTVGNTTLTGEVRFYGGKKPGARGFYLSLYGRYMNVKAAYPDKYETETRIYTLPYNGTLKGFGGGLMIGAQWLIAKRVAFDWYILGANYGNLKVDFPAITDLSTMNPDEMRGLKRDIESVNNHFFGLPNVDATVTDTGVNVRGKVPYIGVRGLGFSLGIAF